MGGHSLPVKKKNEKLLDPPLCVTLHYGFEIGLRNSLDSLIKI